MSDERIELSREIVDGCILALRGHLGREPTRDELRRGLTEMVRDAFVGVPESEERYMAWMERVLGRPCTCVGCAKRRPS